MALFWIKVTVWLVLTVLVGVCAFMFIAPWAHQPRRHEFTKSAFGCALLGAVVALIIIRLY